MLSEARSATRGLRRWRGSVVAMLTLAVGIGTTTALYALVRVVLPGLPGVPRVERVARIYAANPTLGIERSPVALNEYDTALSKASSFKAIGAYADEDATLGTGFDARRVVAGYASPGFFDVLGVPPVDGRVFTAGDLSGPPVVILSQGLWRRQFGGGRLDGATIVVDGVERAVVGVMPMEFHYTFVGVAADLWIPLTRPSVQMPSIVSVYARLRDGLEWAAADAELAGLARRGDPWTWRTIPIPQDTRRRAIGAYAGTLGPAMLVLLIACINVACLLMARGIEREKELSVRRALGATRRRIVGILLTESVVLALVSGAVGGAMAVWLLRVLAAQFAAFQPSIAEAMAVDVRLLPVALAATGVACVLFGTVPALRLSKRDVAASLNGVPAVHRIEIAGYGARDVIVFAEVAVAVGFIVWTAMLYTLFAQLNAVKLGFPADRVVAMRVPAARVADVAARVGGIPGVARVTISSGMLGGGAREQIESGARPVVISRIPVGAAFFETLGVSMIRGRSFDAAEVNGHAAVAVLTETSARQIAGDREPIGLQLRLAQRGEVVIIGVCRDPIDSGALTGIDGLGLEMYVPYEPSPTSRDAVVLARMAGDPHAALRAVAAAAQTPAGTAPPRPMVLADEFRQNYGASGAMVAARVLGSFAILTLLLAASGVFAVMSQSVVQRTREFGIRMAIGATPSRVLGLVLAREGKLIAAAVMTGVVFTMLATQALFSELVSLTTIVPSMWIEALMLSAGVAALAVAFATYRIVRLAPADVLRRL
jgi:putative ABC transport system permease protein